MKHLSSWQCALAAAILTFPLLTSAAPLAPRQATDTADYGPGQFSISASDNPFLSLFDASQSPYPTNFFVRASDGLGYADNEDFSIGAGLFKDASTPSGYYLGPGSCNAPNTCQLIFQTDGNLVYLFNGSPVWNAGTSGTGGLLRFSISGVYMEIFDSSGQNLLYYSNLPSTPSGSGTGGGSEGPGPGTGSPPGGCPGGC